MTKMLPKQPIKILQFYVLTCDIMEFCKCGNFMMPAENNKLRCRACGRTKDVTKDMISKIISKPEKEETVIIEDNTPDRLPTTEKECPKCGNDKAYWWLIQTRSADEPPTQFFRCTKDKCKHTWREYK